MSDREVVERLRWQLAESVALARAAVEFRAARCEDLERALREEGLTDAAVPEVPDAGG